MCSFPLGTRSLHQLCGFLRREVKNASYMYGLFNLDHNDHDAGITLDILRWTMQDFTTTPTVSIS